MAVLLDPLDVGPGFAQHIDNIDKKKRKISAKSRIVVDFVGLGLESFFEIIETVRIQTSMVSADGVIRGELYGSSKV